MPNSIDFRTALSNCQDLIRCADPVDFWVYTREMHLLQTTSNKNILHEFLQRLDCARIADEHFSDHVSPVIISGKLGMMCCVFCIPKQHSEMLSDPDHSNRLIMGPFLYSPFTEEGLNDAYRSFSLPLNWRNEFIQHLLEMPVIPLHIAYRYAQMLHYAITGEKISQNDVAVVSSVPADPEKTKNGKKTEDSVSSRPAHDRWAVYYSEQELLNNVRTGNLNFAGSLNRAQHSVTFTRNPSNHPLSFFTRGCVIFTSLCVRAAIEGGLSPETAYSLGDTYIDTLMQCKSVSAARTINHAMYEDFIQRVHKIKANPQYSPQIRQCMEYIEMHPEEPLSLEQLAALVGYTNYYLSRKFKEETKMALTEYITRTRIERAKLMLSGSTIPVSAIAEKLQFCSLSYFSSKFQKYAGMTPQQYRASRR